LGVRSFESFTPIFVEGAPDYSRTAQQEIYGLIQPGDTNIEFPPSDRLDVWNWYGYGIISIEGNIYQFISHCGERSGFGWFDGSQLIWRPSGKEEWIRWNGTDANDREKWLINEGENQMFLWAANPWGPWQIFYWEENWVADDPENRLYLPQLSPKWISKDGKSMYMVFSDAGRRYKLRYLWNMQKIYLIFN